MTKEEFKVAFNEVIGERALAPIPNQGVSLWSEAQIKVLKRLWNEARSTSEMPELLVNAFNTKLLDGYKEHEVLWPQIFDYITITKKDVDLPGLKGIHVFEVSSGEEKKFIGPCPGEATLTPKKYVSMIPFTEEMLDDSEIDLMGWTLRMMGHRHKQKEDEIAFGAVTTRGGSMNANTSTGLNAAALEAGMAILLNRTITCQGYTERDPITANFLLVDPTHLMQAKELINTSLTVVPNIAATATTTGGTNVFQNILNIIVTPHIDSTYYYMGMAKVFGGALFCRRKPVTVQNWADMLRDVENVKAKCRFTADIVEPDKFVRTAY